VVLTKPCAIWRISSTTSAMSRSLFRHSVVALRNIVVKIFPRLLLRVELDAEPLPLRIQSWEHHYLQDGRAVIAAPTISGVLGAALAVELRRSLPPHRCAPVVVCGLPQKNAPPPTGEPPLPRRGEGPTIAVATWALPGGSSGNGEEEGARGRGRRPAAEITPVSP
jgi:hypothetical protein